MKRAKKRAPSDVVVEAMMKPTIPKTRGMMMCNVRSWYGRSSEDRWQTGKEGEEPDRGSEEERDGVGVAERPNDGGEELIEAHTDSDGSKHKGQDPDFDVLNGHDEALKRSTVFRHWAREMFLHRVRGG